MSVIYVRCVCVYESVCVRGERESVCVRVCVCKVRERVCVYVCKVRERVCVCVCKVCVCV